MRCKAPHIVIALLTFAGLPAASRAADEVNVYSARHYDSDALLYDGFRKATGIPVNLIEGNGPELLARLKAEGPSSPADVFLAVDAGNLWLAERAGIFQPVDSKLLDARVPAHLRDPKNLWFGASTRARAIFVNPKKVDPNIVQRYADLVSPSLKGKVCMRSSSAVYNLSLLGALIARWGDARADAWVKGVVANFARQPAGNDTSLLKAVASGECGVTIANHYYYLRLQKSSLAAERDAAKALTLIWPDQDGPGAHVNISGGGMVKYAPHPAAAVRFLEYLASDAAQRIFTDANYEFPAVATVPADAAAQALGRFKIDPINVSVYGANQGKAQMMFDRGGWR